MTTKEKLEQVATVLTTIANDDTLKHTCRQAVSIVNSLQGAKEAILELFPDDRPSS